MKVTSVFVPFATQGAAVGMARLYRNEVTETRAPPGANSVSYPDSLFSNDLWEKKIEIN
jgi:hypothetical protein